jgi:heme-degrading monooxygenase HmoA
MTSPRSGAGDGADPTGTARAERRPLHKLSAGVNVSETWIRIVIYKTDNAGDAAAIDYIKKSVQEVVRRLEKAPGFQLGYWGNNAPEGRMAAVTYWSSKDAIEKASASLSELHKERSARGISIERAHNVQLFAGAPVESLT